MRLFWKKRFFGIFLKTLSNRIFWPEFVPKIGQKGFPKGKIFFWQKHFSEIFLNTFFQRDVFLQKIFRKILESFLNFFEKLFFQPVLKLNFFEKKIVLKLFWKKNLWKKKWFLHFLNFFEEFLCKFFWKNNFLTN